MLSKKILLNEKSSEKIRGCGNRINSILNIHRPVYSHNKEYYNNISPAEIIERRKAITNELRAIIDFSLSDVYECLEFVKKKLASRNITTFYSPESDSSPNSAALLSGDILNAYHLRDYDRISANLSRDVDKPSTLNREIAVENIPEILFDGVNAPSISNKELKEDYEKPELVFSQEESSMDISYEQSSSIYSQEDINRDNLQNPMIESKHLSATHSSKVESLDRAFKSVTNLEICAPEDPSEELKTMAVQRVDNDEAEENDVNSLEIFSQIIDNLGKVENICEKLCPVNIHERRNSLKDISDNNCLELASQGNGHANSFKDPCINLVAVSSGIHFQRECFQEISQEGNKNPSIEKSNFESPGKIWSNQSISKETKNNVDSNCSKKSHKKYEKDSYDSRIIKTKNHFEERFEILPKDNSREISAKKLKGYSLKRNCSANVCEEDAGDPAVPNHLKFISGTSCKPNEQEGGGVVESFKEKINNFGEKSVISEVMRVRKALKHCPYETVNSILSIRDRYRRNYIRDKYFRNFYSKRKFIWLERNKRKKSFSDKSCKIPSHEPADYYCEELNKRPVTHIPENLTDEKNNFDSDHSFSNNCEHSLVASQYSPVTSGGDVTYSEKTRITPPLQKHSTTDICSEKRGFPIKENFSVKLGECVEADDILEDNPKHDSDEKNLPEISKAMTTEDEKACITALIKQVYSPYICVEQQSLITEKCFNTDASESMEFKDITEEKYESNSSDKNCSEISKTVNTIEETIRTDSCFQEHCPLNICSEQYSYEAEESFISNPSKGGIHMDISSESPKSNPSEENCLEPSKTATTTYQEKNVTLRNSVENISIEEYCVEKGFVANSLERIKDPHFNITEEDPETDSFDKNCPEHSIDESTADGEKHITPSQEENSAMDISFDQYGPPAEEDGIENSAGGIQKPQYDVTGEELEAYPSEKNCPGFSIDASTADGETYIAPPHEENSAMYICIEQYGDPVEEDTVENSAEGVEELHSDIYLEETKTDSLEKRCPEPLKTITGSGNYNTSSHQEDSVVSISKEQYHHCDEKDFLETSPQRVEETHFEIYDKEPKINLPKKNCLESFKTVVITDEDNIITLPYKGNSAVGTCSEEHGLNSEEDFFASSSECIEEPRSDISKVLEIGSSEKKYTAEQNGDFKAESTAHEKTYITHPNEVNPPINDSVEQHNHTVEEDPIANSQECVEELNYDISEEETKINSSEKNCPESSIAASIADRETYITQLQKENSTSNFAIEQCGHSDEGDTVANSAGVGELHSDMYHEETKSDSPEKYFPENFRNATISGEDNYITPSHKKNSVAAISIEQCHNGEEELFEKSSQCVEEAHSKIPDEELKIYLPEKNCPDSFKTAISTDEDNFITLPHQGNSAVGTGSEEGFVVSSSECVEELHYDISEEKEEIYSSEKKCRTEQSGDFKAESTAHRETYVTHRNQINSSINVSIEQRGHTVDEDAVTNSPECAEEPHLDSFEGETEIYLSEKNCSEPLKDKITTEENTCINCPQQKQSATDTCTEEYVHSIEEASVIKSFKRVGEPLSGILEEAQIDSSERNYLVHFQASTTTDKDTYITFPHQENSVISTCIKQQGATVEKHFTENPPEYVEEPHPEIYQKGPERDSSENICPRPFKAAIATNKNKYTTSLNQDNYIISTCIKQHTDTTVRNFVPNLSEYEEELNCGMSEDETEINSSSSRNPCSEPFTHASSADGETCISHPHQENSATGIYIEQPDPTDEEYFVANSSECVKEAHSDTFEGETENNSSEKYCPEPFLSEKNKDMYVTLSHQENSITSICIKQGATVENHFIVNTSEYVNKLHQEIYQKELESDSSEKNCVNTLKAARIAEGKTTCITSAHPEKSATDIRIEAPDDSVDNDFVTNSSEFIQELHFDNSHEEPESDSFEINCSKPYKLTSTAEGEKCINSLLQENSVTEICFKQHNYCKKDITNSSECIIGKDTSEKEPKRDLSKENNLEPPTAVKSADVETYVSPPFPKDFVTNSSSEQQNYSTREDIISERARAKDTSEKLQKCDSFEKSCSQFSEVMSIEDITAENCKKYDRNSIHLLQVSVTPIKQENEVVHNEKVKYSEENSSECPSHDGNVSDLSQEDLKGILNSMSLKKMQDSQSQNTRKRKYSTFDTHYTSEFPLMLTNVHVSPVYSLNSVSQMTGINNFGETNYHTEINEIFIQKPYFPTEEKLYRNHSYDNQGVSFSETSTDEIKSDEFTVCDDKSVAETNVGDDMVLISNESNSGKQSICKKRNLTDEEFPQKRPRLKSYENEIPSIGTGVMDQQETRAMQSEINHDILHFTPTIAISSPSSTEKSMSSVNSFQECTVQKYVSRDDLIFRLLEWDADWLRIQMDTNCLPPIIDEFKEVKKHYESVEEYYNTYFPLLLLNIWLNMFNAWRVCPNQTYYEAKFVTVEENEYCVRMTCSSIMTSDECKDFPPCGGMILVTFTGRDGSLHKSFGYIDYVVKQEYHPPTCNETFKRIPLQKVTFSFYIAEKPIETFREFVKIQILLNIENLLNQNDALQSLETCSVKDVILNPEINKSKIKVIKFTPSSSFHKLQESVLKYISSEDNQIILMHTLPSNRTHAVFKLVKAMMKKHCSLLMCFKDEKKCFMFATYLAEFGLILAVRESEVEIPNYLRKFLLDEQIAQKMNADCSRESILHEILRECNIILTISSSMNLKDVSDNFFDGNSVCILDEANLWLESETMLPLSYNSKKMVLMSNSSRQAEVDPFLQKYGYHESLYSRLYKTIYCA